MKNIKNPIPQATVLIVTVCAVRFLLDGITLSLFGHTLSIGHTDPLAYGTILAPVLGAHGYIHVNKKEIEQKEVEGKNE